MTFARRIRALIILAGLCASCATLRPVVDALPRAEGYLANAQFCVGVAESFEKTYFASHANPDLQAKIEKGIADARVALDAGNKICLATQDLSESQIGPAFAAFPAIYNDILALLGPLGAHRSPPGSHMGATPNGYAIPDPLILSVR